MNYIFVFLGGGLGCVCRYAVSVALANIQIVNFPLATFVSNVMSCLILVLGASLALQTGVEKSIVKMGLLIGFCGGFSTFSTFSYETIELIKNGNHVVAVFNVLLSLVVCFFLVYKLAK